jgi:hypothetical protein
MVLDLKEFKQKLAYAVQGDPSIIHQDLQEIAKFDRYMEKELNQLVWLLVISIVLVVLSCFLLIIHIGFIVLLLLAISGIVYCTIKLIQSRDLNLANERYELPTQLLAMLNRDRDATTALNLAIDFKSSTDQSKQMSSNPHPYLKDWKLDIFADPWFTLAGEFLDHTNFEIKITEINRIASGWKRSRSGKNKYKRKTKFVASIITIRLKYPHSKYSAVRNFQSDTQAAIKLPEYATCKQLKITDKSIFLKVKLLSNVTADAYQAITTMFLSLYQILNLAKKLSRTRANINNL